MQERGDSPFMLLVALFIWFAENLGTFARAWVYPAQQGGWHLVSPAKLGSWYLLMIISFVLVAAVHGKPKAEAVAAKVTFNPASPSALFTVLPPVAEKEV